MALAATLGAVVYDIDHGPGSGILTHGLAYLWKGRTFVTYTHLHRHICTFAQLYISTFA